MRKMIWLAAIAATFAFAAPAHAQYTLKWFYGVWDCTVGGASGQFVFGIGDGDPAHGAPPCDGCTQSDATPVGGHFKVAGFATTYFTEASSSDHGAYLQGPEGIMWFVEDPINSNTIDGRGGVGSQWSNIACAREVKRRPQPPPVWHGGGG